MKTATVNGKTYSYTYDAGGNILTATEDGTTHTYTYGNTAWKDQLTAYDGQTITYDAIGNPLTYRDGLSFTWQNGRQLASATKNGVTTAYTYNGDGSRSSKTVDNVTTQYYYVNGRLQALTKDIYTAFFLYDDTGRPYAIRVTILPEGHTYPMYVMAYYKYNMQGDVVGLYNTSGQEFVTYTYDPWGKPLSSTGISPLLIANPFRYRGYVYDEETGLYYCNSRYYDPETGRWINTDTADVLTASLDSVTDKNLYAYCDNNPVVRVDHGGQFWETVFDVISLGASIVEVCINPTDPWAWAGLAGDAIDLIPFVTGVGEVTRAVKTIDKVADTVQIAKAVDFTDDAADIVKTLDRSSGFTKSTASAGRKIHDGYKVGDGFNLDWKEYKDIKGIRPDYVDFDNKIIYELKPMNPRSARSGIRQLQRYNKALGGGFTMRLELY